MALVGEPDSESNLGDRQLAPGQQLLCSLYAATDHVLMRGNARGFSEGTTEVRAANADEGCEISQCYPVRKVRLDIFLHHA